MTAEGKVTLNKVKYVHHPDGRCHFSQDGRPLTAVVNKSFPLTALPHPHIFSIDVQGISRFEEISATKPVKSKYHYVRFSTARETAPARVLVVGRWGEVGSDQTVESVRNPVTLHAEGDLPVSD